VLAIAKLLLIRLEKQRKVARCKSTPAGAWSITGHRAFVHGDEFWVVVAGSGVSTLVVTHHGHHPLVVHADDAASREQGGLLNAIAGSLVMTAIATAIGTPTVFSQALSREYARVSWFGEWYGLSTTSC